MDKALVVVLIVNDQQVMLLIVLPNSWHTFSMTQRSVPNLFLINLMVISYKKILWQNVPKITIFKHWHFMKWINVWKEVNLINLFKLQIAQTWQFHLKSLFQVTITHESWPNSRILLNVKMITCHYCNKKARKASKCH